MTSLKTAFKLIILLIHDLEINICHDLSITYDKLSLVTYLGDEALLVKRKYKPTKQEKNEKLEFTCDMSSLVTTFIFLCLNLYLPI
jgi:hypothetical protein